MIQLGAKHGRHAIKRRATFGLNGFQDQERVESNARHHHASAMARASKIAQHHAEAVIEGHADTDAVGRRITQQQADEVGVIEDIMVR